MADPTVQTELNRGDLNNHADLLAKAKIGDALARIAGDAGVEETVTVTANVGVLAKRALSILAVAATTADTTSTGSTPCPPSQTPATKQYKVGTDRKTLTFFATDNVSVAKVLYIPAPDGLEAVLAGSP